MKLIQSYEVRIPENLYAYLRIFEELVVDYSNYFLSVVWKDEVIDEIHEYGLKYDDSGEKRYVRPAYKFFEEKGLEPNEEWWKELPSRFRRGIMEKVGEVLRSQKERKDCFYDVLKYFRECYDEEEENGRKRKYKTFKRIRKKMIEDGVYYSYVLSKQVVYQIVNYYERTGELPEKYTECVKPTFKKGTFPFSPDDGRLIRLKIAKDKLILRIKLPVVKDDRSIEWKWFEEELDSYPKLKEMLENYKLKKPTLIRRITKSGYHHYNLILPFEVGKRKVRNGNVLSVDLGERKLVTCVVLDSEGNQLSPPIFIRVNPKLKSKIIRIREEIRRLSSKISKGLDFDGRLFAERRKKWVKLNNLTKSITHNVSKQIVRIARLYRCSRIVFEDLKSYQPPNGRGLLSWLLSMWSRGDLISYTKYKAFRFGIITVTVSAFKSSKICPRCNSEGRHVKSPDRLNEKGYGFFYCPSCGFRADRDYVGALNVGRRFLSGDVRLEEAKPVAYKAMGSPPVNRSHRGTQKTVKTKITF